MSYMRTSEKNCDVYVYSNGHQYFTQVKYREEDPDYTGPAVDLTKLAGTSIEFIQQEMAKGWRIFDNPHAGESYTHDTAQECLDNLLELQKDGVKLSSSGIGMLRIAVKEGKQ